MSVWLVRNGKTSTQGGPSSGSVNTPGNLCVSFHPEAYVRETLAEGFEIVDVVPEGAKGNPSASVSRTYASG